MKKYIRLDAFELVYGKLKTKHTTADNFDQATFKYAILEEPSHQRE